MQSEEIKVGVFICHCGKNIAGTVDVGELLEFAKSIPGVTVAKDYMFLCSEPGQKIIKEALKETHAKRVVVASCSPKLHEQTFRRCIEEVGLNKFLLEMANIREHCSWVHMNEPKQATEKAKALIRAAVKRAEELEEVGTRREQVLGNVLVIGGGIAGLQAARDIARPSLKKTNSSVLVIGGGIAGIQAALDLGDQGFKVFLVERRPVIGGNMARVYKTFPTDDCAMCILSPKMNDIASHPNVEILSYSEVKSVEGSVGAFKVRIEKKPRYVDESKCTGCGVCAEKCPSKAPDEWNKFIGNRKAIYLPYPQGVPRKFTIDKEYCLYFTRGVCRVCEKFCAPQAIKFDQKAQEIEINVAAIVLAVGWEELAPEGLEQYGFGRLKDVVTQLQLARMFDVVGPTQGKLQCLSDGRKPERLVMIQCVGSRDEKNCKYCSSVCCMAALKHAQLIKLEQDPNVDVAVCYTDIRAFGKGYEEYYKRAQELGVRFVRGRVAEITGDAETGGLVVRVEDTLASAPLDLKADLVVLSSATTPVPDSSQLAKILGLKQDQYGFFKSAEPSQIDTDVPGIFLCGSCSGPKDIPDSVAEGSAAASRVSSLLRQKEFEVYLVERERCLGGNLMRIERTYPDEIETRSILDPLIQEVTRNPNIKILAKSQITDCEGHLGNFTVKVAKEPDFVDPDKCDLCGACVDACPVESADNMNLGLSKRKAIYVTARTPATNVYVIDTKSCLFEKCGRCAKVCPKNAIDLKRAPTQMDLNVGAIVVATGWEEYNPYKLEYLGYGIFPNVVTQLQLERMLAFDGPTKGRVKRPSDSVEPHSILMAQCAGARDEHANAYCSRVCCMTALKNARKIKTLNRDVDVGICYMDLRSFGKGHEEYYRETQMSGVTFLRGRVSEILEDAKTRNLTVRMENTLLSEPLELKVELVVLATPMIPSSGTDELAKRLGIDVGSDNFLKEFHPKLRPVDTKVPGIFIAGAAQGPKDLRDSISQALAASSKALIPMTRGTVEIELTKAIVDEEACVGCLICKDTCPYDAIEIIELGPHKKIARVQEIECEGCGSCASACRLGAIQLRHYKDRQIYAQIEGLLASTHAAASG